MQRIRKPSGFLKAEEFVLEIRYLPAISEASVVARCSGYAAS
jgi:hypothetical protein